MLSKFNLFDKEKGNNLKKTYHLELKFAQVLIFNSLFIILDKDNKWRRVILAGSMCWVATSLEVYGWPFEIST